MNGSLVLGKIVPSLEPGWNSDLQWISGSFHFLMVGIQVTKRQATILNSKLTFTQLSIQAVQYFRFSFSKVLPSAQECEPSTYIHFLKQVPNPLGHSSVPGCGPFGTGLQKQQECARNSICESSRRTCLPFAKIACTYWDACVFVHHSCRTVPSPSPATGLQTWKGWGT